MLFRHASRIACLLGAASCLGSAHQDWTDPSPHQARLVTVETGVQLEVLDWGGSGPPIVLLAGGGATAHHYDDFAPKLTARGYRVVGLTRRGHRGSSAPLTGYGFPRRAEDIILVMNAMRIEQAMVVGESAAGEEMHVLGARYPTRVRGLVYVDAAFDRGDDADEEGFNAAARAVPTAPSAQTADKASFRALREHLNKYGGAGPEAYLRTRYRTNPDGTIAGLWAPERPVFEAMVKELRAAYDPYQPARIGVPALAIYALPTSADDLMLRGSSDRSPYPELAARAAADPDLRSRVDTLFRLTVARVRKHAQWYQAFADRGRVVELSGNHDLIVSSPDEVIAHVEAFASQARMKSFAVGTLPLTDTWLRAAR
jgi:pimeloyl-ACP methyl ester carboxylesterase